MLTYTRRQHYGFLFLLLFLLILFPLLQWNVLLLEHSTTTTTTITSSSATATTLLQAAERSFAYAFLVAGCDPERPTYRPFLYNIAVATRLLSQQGSHADVIVLVQMNFHSLHETLPESDLRLLSVSSSSLPIRIQYIPKTPFQSYYRTQFDKFRILNYTQYDQGILFMDADVMPLTNLDYLFYFSSSSWSSDEDEEDENPFQPNWVVAGPVAPANGGFFLLRPTPGAFERVAALLFEQTSSRNSSSSTFDPVQGWGHALTPSDQWETRTGKTGREWTFYAAHADQGFLYHWVKYEQKSVTIVVGQTVQNWGCCDGNGQVQLESTVPLSDLGNGCTRASSASTATTQHRRREPPITCWSPPGKDCMPIYGDYVHFGGRRKPWMKPPPENLARATRWDSPIHLWYWTFMELNAELGLDNYPSAKNHTDWVPPDDPPLGLKPGKAFVRGPPIQLLLG